MKFLILDTWCQSLRSQRSQPVFYYPLYLTPKRGNVSYQYLSDHSQSFSTSSTWIIRVYILTKQNLQINFIKEWVSSLLVRTSDLQHIALVSVTYNLIPILISFCFNFCKVQLTITVVDVWSEMKIVINKIKNALNSYWVLHEPTFYMLIL